MADGEADQTSKTNSQDASMATRTIGSWVEYWCYENQDYYYYNNESQESQWEKPQVFVDNDDYYKNQQNDEDDLSSASTTAGTTNSTLRTPKQRKSHSAGDVTPVNHTLLSSKKKSKRTPGEIFKNVAATIGQQRMNQKKHGISNGSPRILVATPSRNARETEGLQTPSHNNGTSSRHQTSIEKEITKLMRVVHSDRSYTEDAESLNAGKEDATALALQLEKTRLEELEEKYNKNEKAISDLKNLREQQHENNPETNDNDEAQYAQLQNQMLEKRGELSSALDLQKIKTKRAEEEVIKHRQAYEVAMQNILEKEEKIKELKDEISKANEKMASNNIRKDESRQIMIEQAKALEKAKLLAKQHADETDRIRKQQAEDKRALVEARSRILKQKAVEEEQKLMAERLRKMEAENMRLKQMETDHIKLKKI